MCPKVRFLTSVLSLSSVLLCPISGLSLQHSNSSQVDLESDILPKAQVALQRLPVGSAVSVVRMLIDLGFEDDVSIYLDNLGEAEKERFLNLIFQEGGHFGSMATLNYAIDKTDSDAKKNAVFAGCRSLANGKHFALAIELAQSRLAADDLEVIAVDIGTYAYIFGETELAREIINDEYVWSSLIDEVLQPRRIKFTESAEFASSLGIDRLWTEILTTFRFEACTSPTSEQDLEFLINPNEPASRKLCSLFTWSASRAKAQLRDEGLPYYQQFVDLLAVSDMKTQVRWKRERVFLALKYEDEKFIQKAMRESTENGHFDVSIACAGIALRNCDLTLKLVAKTELLKAGDAYFLGAAMRETAMVCDLSTLSDTLQVQVIAALHLSPGQEESFRQKHRKP